MAVWKPTFNNCLFFSVNGVAPKENGSHRRPPSYSIETPYGFHLDLDFVKYVEDIEKGNTIRRVQLQRRPRGRSSGNLSRNLSLPGYGCRPSQWNSTSILFPRTRLADSQQPCHVQCSDGESARFGRPSESPYKTSQAFDEQPLGPHVRPNLLRASSLPLTVLLRKYSGEDPTSPNGSKNFLSQNGSSEDVFHSPGGVNGTFQQLTAALQRVGELEEEIRIIPELKAQICILQEERERLLHTLQSEPDDVPMMDFPRSVVKSVEKKNKANDWMDREYDQLEENVKASSEQVDAIAITAEKNSQATKRDPEAETLVESLQKKITMLEQKLHELECDLERTTNLLKEQERESRLKDERINELTKRHAEDTWVRPGSLRNTPDLEKESVQFYSSGSESRKTNQVGSDEEFKPCATSGPAGSQADMEHHVRKVRELLQEQWECLCRDKESGKDLPPRVRSIQAQLVSLVDLLTLYVSPAGDAPPSARRPMMEDEISVVETWECPKQHNGGDRYSGEVEDSNTRPKDPSEENVNQNISQTEELPSSTLSTRTQELIGETFTETAHFRVTEGQHDEQDSMCEAQCPEGQVAEKEDMQNGRSSGGESEEALHGEGGRWVETDFMNACHFLEKHMDEVSEPNDEMRQALTVVFQQWFHVCAEENSSADTVALYINEVATETPAVLQFLVNMVDDNGNTALHYSVSNSNFSIVKLLLDTGVCDVDLKNKTGYTAVMLASLQPLDTDMDIKVVQQLMELGDVNARAGQVGQTALHLAVRHGRASTVRLLLAHGANVNAQDQAGTTALISACDRGHTDIVRILLQDPDCDISLTDQGSRSALSLATQASHTEIADLLKARSTSTKTHDKCKMA
ncbi:hypothetical protein QTP70_026530 [Hemibagrus guttatus]|uniref:Uncharacterized protein n=1 Tax=Hemibagrus guttatus TaxID=175788 RepID=A0AAE0VBT4_9TELE|nr:hypothetical protein QTP70_026530 [Hemibagrus guttatus]